MVVYITTNILNGKKYIGKDEADRSTYLGSGTYFKNALKKYGKENFKKEILEYCMSKENLIESEKYWTEYFGASKSDLFYNLKDGGCGGNISESTRKKSSESHKKAIAEGRFITPFQKGVMKGRSSIHRRKIIQADFEGNIIKIYSYLTQVKEDTFGIGDVKNACQLKIKHHRKFVWRYYDTISEQEIQNKFLNLSEQIKDNLNDLWSCNRSEEKKAKSRKANLGKKHSQETKEKIRQIRLGSKRSLESIQKCKNTNSNLPILICPYCNLECRNKGVMVRYHFNNCKKLLII